MPEFSPPDAPIEELLKKELLSPTEYFLTGGPPVSTQAKMRMAGTFGPYLKIGRRVYIDVAARRRFLETQMRLSTSDPGAFE